MTRRLSATSLSTCHPATPPRSATKARGSGASLHQGLSLSHAALTERSLCLLPERNLVRTCRLGSLLGPALSGTDSPARSPPQANIHSGILGGEPKGSPPVSVERQDLLTYFVRTSLETEDSSVAPAFRLAFTK